MMIEPKHIYTITCNGISSNVCTQQSVIPKGPIESAPGINIWFPQDDRKYVQSLISKLYFKAMKQ